jgi:hypothetical protein
MGYNPLHPDFERRSVSERSEITTVGIDEATQLIGGDPYGRQAQMGLRVPALALANATPQTSRYLFLLAFLTVPAATVARIRGYRMFASLGANVGGEATYRPVEQQIISPNWHPPGANISWHLQDLGVPNATGVIGIDPPSVVPPGQPLGVDNLAYKMAKSPALLFETCSLVGGYYINLTAYTPPFGGMPYGKSLLGGYGNRYDLSTDWRTPYAWHSMDLPVYGPRCVAFFASVRQANPAIPGYALPAPTNPQGTTIEEQFLSNYPTARYWRVAGSLLLDSQ